MLKALSSGECMGGKGGAEVYVLLVNAKWFNLGFPLSHYFS